MNSLFTIALMFKAFDAVTAPVNKINSTLDTTGKTLDRATGKSIALNSGIERLGTGAAIADRVARGVERIGTAAAAATAKLEALHKRAEKLGEQAQKLEGLGRPLAAGGAISAVGITRTIEEFANLEDAQKRLRTTLMDETGKVGAEFEKLNSLAEKLGTDLPGSTKDMIQMFIALREQGVQTNVILGGAGEAAAKFGALMKISFPEAATHVAKFSESMGVADRDMEKFMDLLQRLKYASGVETGDLAYTFKYAGGALKLLNQQGLTAARDFSTLVGVLASAGIEGSTAGTNMAQAFGRFAEIGHRLDKKAVHKLVGPILDKYDVKLNFFTETGEFKGMREMVVELEKLKALNPQEQIITLKKLFGDEAARPLAVLMKAGVEGYDAMAKRLQQQADMQAKIKEIMGSSKMQFETMTGTAENLTAHIGGVFAKLINLPGILSTLNDLFSRMDGWVLANPRTAGLLAGVVLGITGLSLAGGALLLTIAGMGRMLPAALDGLATLGKGASWTTARITALHTAMQRRWALNRLPDSMFSDVIPGAAKARGGISALITTTRAWAAANLFTLAGLRGLSMALLTNPIGWIALGIGLAALVIYKYWKPISGFFRGLWTGIKEGLKGLQPAWDVFKRVAPILFPILVPLKWIFNLVKALFKPVDDVGGKAENMGLRFGKAIGRILSSVLQLPARMLTAGANIIDSLFKGMMSKIEKPIAAMKGLATRIRGFLPFSPAKEGALRDINRIRLVETIAESIKPAPMVQAMKGATAAAMIAATVTTPVPGLAQPAAGHAQRPAVSTLARPAAAPGQTGGLNITFSPQITVQGGGDPAQISGQVGEAMRISFAEFERMMKQYERQQQRRAF